ncbi:Oxoglutarate and iron-dependent oxygenase degradation C-term-domain-containing protein [Phakopsora pachyrhizi]|nr:Oxoglutarate and iron-dependent oxygenase degradation C-term-domain-containing protein [Phakopsora pachyrhizi]
MANDSNNHSKIPQSEYENTKRIRLAESENFCLRTKDLLSDVSKIRDLSDSYKSSGPYNHCVLENLFEDRILRNARSEIKSSLSFSLKETDIYKVFQTGDLANLDGLSVRESESLINLKRVRDNLYSQEFRDFLNAVTSCGPLSGKQTDMSINNYRVGCHLLNHDDVIGTRRVSYILYLPDPDSPWTPNDGGSLELYPVDPESNHPLTKPSKKITPKWNQIVFFVVQPGRSFHSVEEVFNPKKSRLSISGWFHLPHVDEDGYEEGQRIKLESEKKLKSLGASLDQLVRVYLFLFLCRHLSSTEEISKEDLAHLKKFIDPSFLAPKNISKLREQFVNESQISLTEFLDHEYSCRLKQSIILQEARDLINLKEMSLKDDEEQLYSKGFLGPRFEFGLYDGNKSWEVVGPPHKQRYLTPNLWFENQDHRQSSVTLLLELQRFFSSRAFLNWLRIVTTVEATGHDIKPRRFRPGLDYTLACSNKDRLLELNLSLTPSSGWSDGEIGGWDCYMVSGEEDQSDPAVYKSSSSKKQNGSGDIDDSTLLTIYPSFNTMEIVLRDCEVLNFTKYVSFRNNYSSKWDIKGVYQIKESDEEGGL